MTLDNDDIRIRAKVSEIQSRDGKHKLGPEGQTRWARLTIDYPVTDDYPARVFAAMSELLKPRKKAK